MSTPEWGDKAEQDKEENESQKDYFENNKGEVLIILICGPSGCGKGSLAKKIGSKKLPLPMLMTRDLKLIIFLEMTLIIVIKNFLIFSMNEKSLKILIP